MLKIMDNLRNGFKLKKFDEIDVEYLGLYAFFEKDKNNEYELKIGFKEDTNVRNSKYSKTLDSYYFPQNISDFILMIDSNKLKKSKKKYLPLKIVHISYKDTHERYAMGVDNNCYVLNDQGDTMQKI